MLGANGYEVIIVGGSYAGLSAAMSLGRALRKVLIIDNGKPCNAQTLFSHNFLTRDGSTPTKLSDLAKKQVAKYSTVSFYKSIVTIVNKTEKAFEIKTEDGKILSATKLIFATGVKDLLPSIPGFAECWGISILHCPYCHGYEVRNKHTAILANGDLGFEFVKLISNWTNKIILLTNGKSTISPDQKNKIIARGFTIIENDILAFEHQNGRLRSIKFSNGDSLKIQAVYARVPFTQNCTIPAALDCEITEQGLIKTDMFYKTSQPGIYACGDCTTMFRAVSNAVSAGNITGAVVNKDLIEESFQ